MAFKMQVDSLSYKVIPAGIYEMKFAGFKPKWSKNKDSVNFNAIYEVINNPEYDGSKIFESMSSKAGFIQTECTHCFGIPMEDLGNGSYALPGVWDGKPESFKEDDPTSWVYEGPLTGRTGKMEIAIDSYEGRENNKVRQYFCALTDAECATQYGKDKHKKDLLAKK
ncbi:MAG TPA: hypothetical protein VGF75_08165 [Candidatus Saccharimonadales bacterium]|jgi:hypothetical protein